MDYKHLLAKSHPQECEQSNLYIEEIGLPFHLMQVHEAACKVLDATADEQLNAFGLAPNEWRERFWKVVRLAAALHDLGKANDHFQEMILFGKRQGLRHEWATYLILQEPLVQQWVKPAVPEPLDWLALLSAICGHHPGVNRPSPPQNMAVISANEKIITLMGHSEFYRCLVWIASTFELEEPPSFQDKSFTLLTSQSGNAFEQIQHAINKIEPHWDSFNTSEKMFIACVKACLIGADVAGSAIPKLRVNDNAKGEWIHNVFSFVPQSEEMECLVKDRLSGENTDDPDVLARTQFQDQVSQSVSDVTFVKAGCGTGKTIAAYRWAAAQCPGKRLYFCYPTTGTATEGFRDYLFDEKNESGKFGADLFHSRAEVDFEMILEVNDSNEDNDSWIRIESLDAWSTPIVCCTVDTVLGLMKNHRRSLYAWPALAGAAFVFDEIHAYDETLFGALLRFLKELRGVPVLLMTASLPKHRMEDLKDKIKRRGIDLLVISGPERLENRPRYHRLCIPNEVDPVSIIREELDRCGKVLWICNTVNRTMEAYERASDQNLYPIIYHSHFRYKDRVKRHKRVMQAFKESAPALSICTQVAEMSLDISATMLVTDLAPVPSLIQRLGRLNRRAKENDETRPFIIIEPLKNGQFKENPYCLKDYPQWPDRARNWLETLPVEKISQMDLAQAWERLPSESGCQLEMNSNWLDGGAITTIGELRKATPGITVLLEEDAKTLRSMPINRASGLLSKYLLPMSSPYRNDSTDWARFMGIYVVPNERIEYDAEKGARWK